MDQWFGPINKQRHEEPDNSSSQAWVVNQTGTLAPPGGGVGEVKLPGQKPPGEPCLQELLDWPSLDVTTFLV